MSKTKGIIEAVKQAPNRAAASTLRSHAQEHFKYMSAKTLRKIKRLESAKS